MNDCLHKLADKRNKVKHILFKFESELNEPNENSSLNSSHLEEKAQDLINLLEKEILPIWSKYEENYRLLLNKLTEAN